MQRFCDLIWLVLRALQKKAEVAISQQLYARVRVRVRVRVRASARMIDWKVEVLKKRLCE